ncbi:hypothetical protein [Urbifossiella limnaea]|uniref:Uncharacterized protein n=1 Tax=Urbifossiella limnaea TaxID=2528023 RepID=A0A517XLU8_9BACT|nr:hypothetical protein [Urbifossiella limnaea]QDU18472.1 hypothetical protein ETAA1_03600 [Urbifossiella limnaea]
MKYWCANFGQEDCLRHGIAGMFWLMHYQYAEGDTGNRRNRIAVNYSRLREVREGHMLVAYLPTNTFFAYGEVIAPRLRATTPGVLDKIKDYVTQYQAYESGVVYFDDAIAYENHTSPWRAPEGTSYPVRIDVDAWQNYEPDGVVVNVVNEVPINERIFALFELTQEQFERIVARLRSC